MSQRPEPDGQDHVCSSVDFLAGIVARFEGNVAAVGVLEVLGAQRPLASPDGPTCGFVTSVCHSVSCANPMLVQRPTRLAAEQFGNAIRGSQIGDMGSGSLLAPSGADMPHSRF
jgi:hypothetical protein